VIFRYGLEHNAPPEIAVDLNVPFIPARIGGIAPSFLLQQLEHSSQKVMPVFAFFAPISAPPGTAHPFRTDRQWSGGHDTARRPLEMQPGKVTRPASHQRLNKGQGHDEQPRVDRIEFRLDPRSHHKESATQSVPPNIR
jgi:hypothetical protein